MFFKNVTAFKLNQEINPEQLMNALEDFAFKSCAPGQASSTGWAHPFIKDHEDTFHSINSFHLLCLKTEDKILPAQVVNEHTQQKIEEIERLQNTKIGKHEKATIKDEVQQMLLTKAFSKSKQTYGYIDAANGFLVIDSNSDKTIDDFTALLRKSLGSLKIQPMFDDISAILTSWFKENAAPTDIVIEDKCKLVTDQGDGVANITCQGNTMLSDNILAFIEAGGAISELAISWRDQISLTINDRFQWKSIKFLEGLKDLNTELDKEDKIVRQEADFLLMAETFAELLNQSEDYFNTTDNQKPLVYDVIQSQVAEEANSESVGTTEMTETTEENN
ncbi:recombination-associated protein RdgC [Cysteiniphilum litorale]|uniref:recombination-associated protein RdgC n=1 Tax=Cysteiniphilum litorale TaxID=2056700 RepID=UPI003F885568